MNTCWSSWWCTVPLHQAREGTIVCVNIQYQRSRTTDIVSYHQAGECGGAESGLEELAKLRPTTPIISYKYKYKPLFSIIIQPTSLLQPLYPLSLKYFHHTAEAAAVAGLTLRRWLAGVPSGAHSDLPDNSFTAQELYHWWQQLSPRERIISETRNTSKPENITVKKAVSLTPYYYIILLSSSKYFFKEHHDWRWHIMIITWEFDTVSLSDVICHPGIAVLYPLRHMWPMWLGRGGLRLTPSPKWAIVCRCWA